MNIIKIKVEYLEGGESLFQYSDDIDTNNTTLSQTCKLASETFGNNLSNVLADLLTK